MKHLSLTAVVLVAALFSLSSCQKGLDEIPESTEPTAPAVLQSIIESPDGKEFLLTKLEEVNETYPEFSYSLRFMYDAEAALNEWQELNTDEEVLGTAKVSYDKQQVTMMLTPRDQSWEGSITLKLTASGWPSSFESIEKADSRVLYSILETYTLNAENYITEENSSWIEHSEDPLLPLSKDEKRYRYFYEGGNLVKVEVFDKGSSTPEEVMLFEYDTNKLNLLKAVTDYGNGLELLFKKPSKNLLLKVETLVPDDQSQELLLSMTANYTYTMNTHGLPAEVLRVVTSHSDSGQTEDSRYTTKLTYTEL